MNTQEREQLAGFLQQLTQTQPAQKDSEADTLIREACARQPDAAYLLVQRSMLLDQALQNAQGQISRLQDALNQAKNEARNANGGGGFLDANAWGNSPAMRSTPLPPPARYPSAPAPVAAPTPVSAPSAWGSGMLGNVATTAAGVVAGAFLFQGIEHLIGGSHGAHSASTDGLSGRNEPPPGAQHDSFLADSSTSADANGNIFDTGSVDDFIADDGV